MTPGESHTTGAGRGPPWDHFEKLATMITILLGICAGVSYIDREGVIDVWLGRVALIALSGVVLAVVFVRHSRRWRLVAAIAWSAISAGLIAHGLVRGGLTWQKGHARWILFDVPVLVAALVLFSATARKVARAKIPFHRKVVAAALAISLSFISLVGVGICAAAVHDAVADNKAITVPVHAAVVRPPPDLPSDGRAVTPVTSFPVADSICVDRLDIRATRPDGIDDAGWKAVLRIVKQYPRWKLCRVGIKTRTDGVLDVKVFSATSGPEGHILVKRDLYGNSVGRFVKPQAGQLYYQQPGGNSLASWGFPDVDIPCGNGGRLVIFRGPNQDIAGFSRWSAPIEATTAGTLAAYYTPAAIGLPLVTDLERLGLPLPLGRGFVVSAPNGTLSQNFAGQLSIRSDDPTKGVLTAERLLARC